MHDHGSAQYIGSTAIRAPHPTQNPQSEQVCTSSHFGQVTILAPAVMVYMDVGRWRWRVGGEDGGGGASSDDGDEPAEEDGAEEEEESSGPEEDGDDEVEL